jgi:hypothetical protein
MDVRRLEVALRELRADQWHEFEQLASTFLASEYPELRTLAAPSGDEGRDAILFAPEGNTQIAIQYSITTDWKQKIRKTANTLRKNFSNQHTVLLYLTSIPLGPDAEQYRATILKDFGLYLDPRGASWFLDRVNRDRATEEAAERLAKLTVDRLLAADSIVASKGRALTSAEARAGLVYLGLQWEDDTREKGLTRLAYEALVRAALRDTDADHRLGRADVQRRVKEMVPGHPGSFVEQQVTSALNNLNKKSVRYTPKSDEFHLTFDEQQRLKTRLQQFEAEDRQLEDELGAVLQKTLEAQGLDITTVNLGDAQQRLRRLVERFLYGRGEAFAAGVLTGQLRQLDLTELREMAIKDVQSGGVPEVGVAALVSAASVFLSEPGAAVQGPFRRLADSYTLFAFLRETQDVQSAVSAMFSHGEIWLDASIVLPAMAEDLLPEEERRFSNLLKTAGDLGLALRVIPGVLDEVSTHLQRCRRFLQIFDSGKSWEGSVPFLVSVFIASGRARSEFPSWVDQFAGDSRPSADIERYLGDAFGVEVHSLEKETDAAPLPLRAATQEIWQAAHDRRRSGVFALDPGTIQQLVAHDVESYVGVVMKRTRERMSMLGYTSWWLTLDTTAFAVRSLLQDSLAVDVPDSPVLSPDFLVNYLAVGPLRAKVSVATEARLPVVLDLGVWDLPLDVIRTANDVRVRSEGVHERVIQRRVRDELDAAKRRRGPIAREGVASVEKKLRERLARLRAPVPDQAMPE